MTFITFNNYKMYIMEINNIPDKRINEFKKLFATENIKENFLSRNFVAVINNEIVAFAALEKNNCFFIESDNNIIERNNTDNYKTKQILNMYNLTRLKDNCYKGITKYFIEGIYKIVNKPFYFATIHEKLYSYYISLGYKPTKYYDICINNYYRKCFICC